MQYLGTKGKHSRSKAYPAFGVEAGLATNSDHSKLGRKPKDKAKEAAEKAKGQKSAHSNSEGSFLDFFAFTNGIF